MTDYHECTKIEEAHCVECGAEFYNEVHKCTTVGCIFPAFGDGEYCGRCQEQIDWMGHFLRLCKSNALRGGGPSA